MLQSNEFKNGNSSHPTGPFKGFLDPSILGLRKVIMALVQEGFGKSSMVLLKLF